MQGASSLPCRFFFKGLPYELSRKKALKDLIAYATVPVVLAAERRRENAPRPVNQVAGLRAR